MHERAPMASNSHLVAILNYFNADENKTFPLFTNTGHHFVGAVLSIEHKIDNWFGTNHPCLIKLFNLLFVFKVIFVLGNPFDLTAVVRKLIKIVHWLKQ